MLKSQKTTQSSCEGTYGGAGYQDILNKLKELENMFNTTSGQTQNNIAKLEVSKVDMQKQLTNCLEQVGLITDKSEKVTVAEVNVPVCNRFSALMENVNAPEKQDVPLDRNRPADSKGKNASRTSRRSQKYRHSWHLGNIYRLS